MSVFVSHHVTWKVSSIFWSLTLLLSTASWNPHTPQSMFLSSSLRWRVSSVERQATDMWKASCQMFLRPKRKALHKMMIVRRVKDFSFFWQVWNKYRWHCVGKGKDMSLNGVFDGAINENIKYCKCIIFDATCRILIQFTWQTQQRNAKRNATTFHKPS